MRPNDYIINTKYATLKNDAKGTLSITIPASFQVNVNSAPLSTTANIGQKSAGMYFSFSSSKYPGVALIASQIVIPCTSTYTSTSGQQVTLDNDLNCYVYRSAPGQVCMEISPSIPGDIASSTMTITDAAQTVSCKVSTILSPFEA